MHTKTARLVRRKGSAIGTSVATLGVALSSIVVGPLPSAFAATSSAALSAMSGLASCPGGPKGTLNLAEDEGGPFVNNYNPFTGSHTTDTMSYVYETLLQFDLADSSVVSPWLSSSYAWSDNGKTLVFQLRHGIKWSDGKPFTSADVVFTFDLLKKDPATNIKGIAFSTVSAEGPYTVKMTFSSPEYSELFYIGTQYIIPEHIWASVKDPTKYTNSDPIGTGPYLLKSLAASGAIYTPNPHYWIKGLPCIAKISEPAYFNNTPADQAMENGTGDWGGLFVGSSMGLYTRTPGHEYWNPPTNVVALYPNLTQAPMNSLPLREAISDVLNRPLIEQLGELGEETPVANKTAVILPRDKAQLAPQYAKDNFRPNLAAAKAVLKKAGYSFSSRNGQLMNPGGKPVVLNIGAPAAFSDWVTAVQEVARELSAIGIKATADPIENTTYFTDLGLGKFQLAIDATELGPNSFYQYDGLMYSLNSAPIGKLATFNLERFHSAAADALIQSYLSTDNPVLQKKDMAGLEGIMVNQLPVIPMYYATDWGLYSTVHFSGWPSPKNPYDITSPYDAPMNEVVLLHLTYKS